MKTNVWLTFTTLLAAGAVAQTTTNSSPAAAAPSPVVTPAPAFATTPAKPEKKRVAKSEKPAATPKRVPEKPVFLFPGPATITGDNLNVRGQATIYSEVVTQLNSGDHVTVIEQVIRDNPKPGDPTQWAKIAVPPGVHLWVHGAYIDPTNKVVLPTRLNVRTGPGENYSVVGLLEQGAPIKEISAKGNWIEIEAPAEAYAFVAASYVKQEGTPAATVPPVVSIAPPVVEPEPTPAVVPEPAPVATTTTEAAATTPAPTPEPTAVTPAPEAQPEPVPPPSEEPPPTRIVQHEGIVKGTWSIQAPTKFALVDPSSGKTVNYLYTSSTNLDLRRYKGLHIIVTGEEGLDERWKNTPVITIQRIQVIQ